MSDAALSLILLDGTSSTRVENVTSVVAADASGQFGLLPGHDALVTVLEPGLFRYRQAYKTHWSYGACVGGLLSCSRTLDRTTQVRIVSRRFLHGDQPEVLQTRLDELLQREGMLRVSTRESRERLDLAFYKRMQQFSQTQT